MSAESLKNALLEEIDCDADFLTRKSYKISLLIWDCTSTLVCCLTNQKKEGHEPLKSSAHVCCSEDTAVV